MIATSRERTSKTECDIPTAARKTKRTATASGKRNQVQVGSTPKAKRKTRTITRLRPRLKRPGRTVEIGITRRGNCVLRTTPSWATTEVTEFVVDSWKKV